VSHVFLDTRDGALRLYLSGDLQFDSRDEPLYHEPLALVPVGLAAARAPGRPLRVLLLGGGDGLALREVLRFPAVREVVLVDRDPEVLALGAGPLAGLNREAFRDPRVRVIEADARRYLGRARDVDALVYDLTYPADVAGAALFSVPLFRKARAALRPGGVLALNAVSPELTPEAFGCLGASLGAAGLAAVGYAFGLPSFAAEGYGRWGFLYASARAIGPAEIRHLAFPRGATLTPAAVLAGLRFPAGAAGAMRVAPNETDELLYYLFNGSRLPWEGPWRPLRFAARPGRPGPRLTVAHGFARWLAGPEGSRTLAELVGCLPRARQDQTRETVLEWSEQAESLFREVDLAAFVEHALRRARALPRVWVRELTALRDRLRAGLPSLDELLHHAYRVFAVYLLALLLANLFFPDNLYAKGWSGSSSSRSGSSWSSGSSDSDFFGFHFSSPPRRPAPFRFRSAAVAGPPGLSRTRVYDREGREYPAQHLALAGPGGPTVPALLALTPMLQLLEGGRTTYASGIPGYQCLLEPGRLRVLAGPTEIMSLAPPPSLEADTAGQLGAQRGMLDKALADHRRWLEWTRWAAALPPGRAVVDEQAELEALRRSVDAARATWQEARAGRAVAPEPRWTPLFPGIYLEPGQPAPGLVLVGSDGQVTRRSVEPPATLAIEDRFLFGLLHRRVTVDRDAALAAPVARWIATHGRALGVTTPPPSAPRARV
jgi:spermidine synthase